MQTSYEQRMNPPPTSMTARRVWPKMFLAAASLAAALAIAEGVCRYLLGERLAVPTDERNLLYRFDTMFGWFPAPGSKQSFVGERRITVTHNALGCRDVEFAPAPTPGRPRILFLGDSFVWGYDVEAEERFTDLIRAHRPDWEILNCGVSGYSTDQELLLLERLAPLLLPDVVVLEFNHADRLGNRLVANNGSYGKPYFAPDGDGLALRNVPVRLLAQARWSESALYRASYLWRLVRGVPGIPILVPVTPDLSERLVDAVRARAAAAGAAFVLLLESTDEEITRHAAAQGIPLVAPEAALQALAARGVAVRYRGHGLHWTPAGHRVVATEVERVLDTVDGGRLRRR